MKIRSWGDVRGWRTRCHPACGAETGVLEILRPTTDALRIRFIAVMTIWETSAELCRTLSIRHLPVARPNFFAG